jgi:hypothetical protein
VHDSKFANLASFLGALFAYLEQASSEPGRIRPRPEEKELIQQRLGPNYRPDFEAGQRAFASRLGQPASNRAPLDRPLSLLAPSFPHPFEQEKSRVLIWFGKQWSDEMTCPFFARTTTAPATTVRDFFRARIDAQGTRTAPGGPRSEPTARFQIGSG